MTTKYCKKCDATKAIEEFGQDRHSADGRTFYCKACKSAAGRRHYRENKEQYREKTRRWREANPEQSNEIYRRWYAANWDQYSEANRERLREKSRLEKTARRQADPLFARIDVGITRAKGVGAPFEKFTSAELLAHWAANGIAADKCFYCPGPFEHLDHAYPLRRENTPGHIVSNVVPSCGSCNIRKQKRTAEEFKLALLRVTT